MEQWDWTPYLAAPDEAPEDVHARWHAAGLIDGLPIVPPTTARVRRLYRDAGMDPTPTIAALEPSLRPVSVYDVAVCATAAGCRPEHLPIVVAAVRAVAAPAFNLLGIQTTTGTAAPAILVHGPIAARAGVSGGADCLGGSAQANAAIGRALRIVLRSLGGASTGGMDAATMGQPAKLGLCFAENTARSPWPPLHTERGFRDDTNAVTVAGIAGTIEVVHAESDDPAEILITLAGSLTVAGNAGSRGLIGGGSPLIVLSPEHARALAAAGFDRAAVQRELWRRATLPLATLAPSLATRVRRSRREAGLAVDHPLRIADQPEAVLIAVAGGIGIKSTVLPSWGGGTRAMTVGV